MKGKIPNTSRTGFNTLLILVALTCCDRHACAKLMISRMSTTACGERWTTRAAHELCTITATISLSKTTLKKFGQFSPLLGYNIKFRKFSPTKFKTFIRVVIWCWILTLWLHRWQNRETKKLRCHLTSVLRVLDDVHYVVKLVGQWLLHHTTVCR